LWNEIIYNFFLKFS